MHILVVDDEPELVDIVTEMFQSEGLKATGKYSGSEALHVCEQEPVDIVLSDAHMPDMSGLDLLKKLVDRQKKTPLFYLWTGDDEFLESDWIAQGGTGIF